MTRKGRRSNPHPYPRTARLNELVREIVADELERIDDERLELVTVITVDVDATLHQAVVYVDSPFSGHDDETMLEALGDHRKRLQAAIGRQARIKRTPELLFRPDDVERNAAHLDLLLRDMRASGELRDDEVEAEEVEELEEVDVDVDELVQGERGSEADLSSARLERAREAESDVEPIRGVDLPRRLET